MGEHKDNLDALVKATMPSFPPLNRDVAIELSARAMPKLNVILMRPGEEPDPVRLAAHKASCEQAGRQQVVHELGQPLSSEHCDVVLLLLAGWFDTSSVSLTAGYAGGTVKLPGELLRLDMREFIRNAEASIGGSRIVVPGLELATH